MPDVAELPSRRTLLPGLLAIAALVILLELVGTVIEQALEGSSRFDLLARNSVVLIPVHLASTLTALLLGGGAFGVMLAQLATGIVGLVLIVRLARRASILAWKPGRLEPDLQGRVVRFARHGYWLGLLTFAVYDRTEVLVLGALTTPEAVGYYTAGLSAAQSAMSIGPVIVASVFFPLLAADWAGTDRVAFAARYAQCMRYLMLAAAPLALGGIALAEVGVAVLLGPAYEPMVPVLRLLLLAQAATALARGPNAILVVTERQDWLLRVRGPLAVANLGLDLLLVPQYSALGAAWVNLVIACAELLLLGVLAWRLVGMVPPLSLSVPLVAGALAALAASWALGDRVDALGLVLGVLAAIPVYAACLVLGRYFRADDVELVAPLLERMRLRIAGRRACDPVL